ncbi:SPOR domain-containing protein [Streptomyces sp. NPDC091279]|uniref:SPOR domain-containing protein n=1 Tax=unclassified Streptomyces TaxID=2593676 RepID=UPI003802ECC6
MEAVIGVLGLLFVLFVVLGGYAVVKAVGAASRGVDRTITQARRTVEDHTLRAKSFAQPGAAGELAQLRLRLRTSMRATQDALHAGVAQDESLKESLGLFERLSAHGHELDDELRRLESEPDRVRLAERLPGLRERTVRVIDSADSLRWAALDRAQRFADDDLDSLSAQIDVEAGALRHWTTEPRPAGRTEPTASPWPETPSASSAGSPHASGAEERTRPAITPTGPRPTYPWQKKPRPESTT